MPLKKELNDVTGIGASNLAAKRDFINLKADIDKININELADVSTDLNNLETKVEDLDISKFKTVPIDLKKLSDVLRKEVVKKQNWTH